ncbi:MAG: indole-3-glycerol-phosphate synthase TrpC, partial [Lysobacterales bacterium]
MMASLPDILKQIITRKHAEVAERSAALPLAQL